jgi:Putative Actinobacterial Holin-X, holin superfamily III
MEQSAHEQTGRRDASTAELLRDLSEQTSRLVRQELELAKAELSVKAKSAGAGAGMLGGAGALGLYALGAVTAAIIAALSLVFATWLAALVVAVVYAAAAGALALMGKTKVQRAIPPVPQDSIDSVKEDVRWTKTRAQQGRG